MHAGPIRAVDMHRLDKLDFQHLKTAGGLRASQLPTTHLDRSALDPTEVAVVSWRWDLVPPDGPSMNLAAAICAAQQAERRYLLFDLVSVAQDQHKQKLIEDIANLGAVFSSLPVFAAYDEEGLADWLPTMRRPWLFFEARAFHSNPHQITYASHQPKQGGESDFGFAHMLKRVWETNYTSSVLLVLAGRTGIGELSDFAHIIPHHRSLLTSACQQLSRNDFLLTAAILCQVFYDDGRFHIFTNDPSLDLAGMTFDRYTLSPTTGADQAYDYFDILLDGKKVASYHKRMKLDRYTLEPVYVRYLTATTEGGELIHNLLHPSSLANYLSELSRIHTSFSLPSVRDDIRIETVKFYPETK